MWEFIGPHNSYFGEFASFSGLLGFLRAPYFLPGFFFVLVTHPIDFVKPGHPSLLGPFPSGLNFLVSPFGCAPSVFSLLFFCF